MTDQLNVGDVVISKAGRDKGRCFVVYSLVDAQFVTVVDGDLRGVSRPKLKRGRHLKPTAGYLAEIAGMLERGETPGDHEIRKALKDAGYEPHVKDSADCR